MYNPPSFKRKYNNLNKIFKKNKMRMANIHTQTVQLICEYFKLIV